MFQTYLYLKQPFFQQAGWHRTHMNQKPNTRRFLVIVIVLVVTTLITQEISRQFSIGFGQELIDDMISNGTSIDVIAVTQADFEYINAFEPARMLLSLVPLLSGLLLLFFLLRKKLQAWKCITLSLLAGLMTDWLLSPKGASGEFLRLEYLSLILALVFFIVAACILLTTHRDILGCSLIFSGFSAVHYIFLLDPGILSYYKLTQEVIFLALFITASISCCFFVRRADQKNVVAEGKPH
jgi:hypothetical protein